MKRFLLRWAGVLCAALVIWSIVSPSTAAPLVQELRVQAVGGQHYFHVRIEPPANLLTEQDRFRQRWDGPVGSLAPRLVAPDGELRVVCQRVGREGRDPRFIDKDVAFPFDKLDKDGPPRPVDKDDRFPFRDKDVVPKDRPFPEKKDGFFPDKDFPKDKGFLPPRDLPRGAVAFVQKDEIFPEKDRPKDFPRDKDIPAKDFFPPGKDGFGPGGPVGVRGLEFVGRYDPKATKVEARLLYAVPGQPLPILGRFQRPPAPVWKELVVVLDFTKATFVAVPREAAQRSNRPLDLGRGDFRPPPVRDDIEGLWAVAQAEQFLALDDAAPVFGFYNFAALATARKYGVMPSRLPWQWEAGWERGALHGGPLFPGSNRLYDLTTGATALTESLQLRRMTTATGPRDEGRAVPLERIPGITIAEHPWEKMIGDKKPAAEPLARMVPHDNYYVAFRDPSKLLEFATLLDQWGGNVTRTVQIADRDYRLWDRYEKQLCLSTAALGKNLGSLGLKGVGVTGNDAYLRDGTDLTLLLPAADPKAVLAACEPLLAEARKTHGARLKEGKADHNGASIESFVTPLREVSLYRTVLDGVVVLSNSPAGVRRVVDAAQGKAKRLSDALDFQYMRVVFRADDEAEDGFAFLPDAFIRSFVGPASRIKQKRRLEALVSLHMLTHGALYAGWDAGKVPATTEAVLRASGLTAAQVPMPDGKPAAWDAEQQAAVSDVYGSIHFATPLVELEIDSATPTEAQDYARFRAEYLNLWRQFFDPVGMRLAMKGGQVKLETYILPLIENSAYNALRLVTGSGTVEFDPAAISDRTLGQFLIRLTGDANERAAWFMGGSRPADPRFGRERPIDPELGPAAMMAWAFDPLGEWALIRVDDSPNFEKLAQLLERQTNGSPVDTEEVARLIWTLPVAVGVDVKNPVTVAATLTALRTSAMMALPGGVTWGPLEKEYKGVPIVRVGATAAGRRLLERQGVVPPGQGGPFRRDPFLPALYYAMVDRALYVTLNEETMQGLIDGAVAKRENKGKLVEVATSLYVAPGAAEQTKGLVKRLLEMRTSEQARAGLPVWYALYRCGVVAPGAKPEQAADAAFRYLGYVPVAPDGTPYRYDRATDEVASERHGSLRRPVVEKTTAESSPVNRLLESLRWVRADLRFREDGIHTTVTIDRGKGGK